MRDYYAFTNEELEAIVKGLDVNSKDIVLAVGGSGDQAFALLEYAKKVTAVDNNPPQIKYIKKRIEFLKNKDFEKFLKMPDSVSLTKKLLEIIERRNKYFEKKGRLDRICEKIDAFKIIGGDIFELAQTEKYNKLYLSDASPDIKKRSIVSLKKIVDNMPLDGLIYCAHGQFLENMFLKYYKEKIPPELKLDEKLTNKVRDIQEGKFIWKPSVYRRVYK